jgi:hypothetical protein
MVTLAMAKMLVDLDIIVVVVGRPTRLTNLLVTLLT